MNKWKLLLIPGDTNSQYMISSILSVLSEFAPCYAITEAQSYLVQFVAELAELIV